MSPIGQFSGSSLGKSEQSELESSLLDDEELELDELSLDSLESDICCSLDELLALASSLLDELDDEDELDSVSSSVELACSGSGDCAELDSALDDDDGGSLDDAAGSGTGGTTEVTPPAAE